MIRFQYRCVMRPRVGDPSGNFVADWNFVPDTNAILHVEGGNSFCSSHWDPERVDALGIGEVRQLFYASSKATMPAYLTGARHCGTDGQWSRGYPVGTPSVVYVGHNPTCCFLGIKTLASQPGGLRLGGSAAVPWFTVFPIFGGLVLGGDAPAGTVYTTESLDGGLVLGGDGIDPTLFARSAFSVSATSTVSGVGVGYRRSLYVVDVVGSVTGVAGNSEGVFSVTAGATTTFLGLELGPYSFTVNASASVTGTSPNIQTATFNVSAGATTAVIGEQATTVATQVQGTSGSGVSVADTSAVHWPMTTTAGNTLIVALAVSPATNITPPAGWQLAVTKNPGGTVGSLSIYYYPNAPAHSGGEAFALTSSASAWSIELLEVAGIRTAAPLDQTASNSSLTGSTTADSGTTGTTGQKFEFGIATFLLAPYTGAAGPSSPWVFIVGQGYATVNQHLEDYANLSAIGTAHVTHALTLSTPWVGCVATFRLS